MKYIVLIFFLLSIFHARVAAQETAGLYYEKETDSTFSFYFDEQYFLTDKKCEFAAYKRVTSYNPADKSFSGAFTDYYGDGAPALTGVYENGKKNGVFKGYYPSGYLKYQVNFTDDKPTGDWTFYYPSGRPQTIYQYKNGVLNLLENWDTSGKKTVTAGNGRFTFTNTPFMYNDVGYKSIIYTGKITDGQPNGVWSVYLKHDKGPNDFAGSEVFRQGKFISGYNNFMQVNYIKNPVVKIIAPLYFVNAEKLVSKNCTVDEHLDYTKYLKEHLQNTIGDFIYEQAGLVQNMTITFTVNEKGQSSNIQILNQNNQFIIRELTAAIKEVRFWIPSQKDGKAIKDNFTVKTGQYLDEKGNAIFEMPVISREMGR